MKSTQVQCDFETEDGAICGWWVNGWSFPQDRKPVLKQLKANGWIIEGRKHYCPDCAAKKATNAGDKNG